MESKITPRIFLFALFLINLVKEALSDIVVKSPHQLAEQFKGKYSTNQIYLNAKSEFH